MGIKVDEKKCIGCGECVLVCPCDVIRLSEETGVSFVKYSSDCQLCNLCVYYCPVNALELTSEKHGKLVLSWS